MFEIIPILLAMLFLTVLVVIIAEKLVAASRDGRRFHRAACLYQRAAYIQMIADDVIDYFRLKYPSAHWSVWLDRAVDRIIEITEVKRDTADRVAKAAVRRASDSESSDSHRRWLTKPELEAVIGDVKELLKER